MTVPVPQAALPPRLTAAISTAAEEIAAVLRTCQDSAVRIPGAEWSVGEAAAHLLQANELMAALADGREQAWGDGTPSSLAAANAEALAAFTERDPAVLADGIVEHAVAFNAAAAKRSADETSVTPMGAMDLATLGSYLLTHMLAHGYDMAVALRRPHMIDHDGVDLSLPFLRAAMPRAVAPRTVAAGHNACYDLRVRGGARFAVTFTDGAAAVTEEPPRRPDCTIVAEPVTFFLLALGRRTPTAALFGGKIVSWGRKPWLAPGFPGLFAVP
jgi:uncharacterized protein (TIGR03083 family)